MSSSVKHCLIVGMGSGLSLAIAQRFAREGFVISALARNGSALDSFRSELPASSHYHYVATGVADQEALAQAIATCERSNGPVSVLVYNVAEMLIKPLLEVSPQELRQSLAVNVEGALIAAQAVLPSMIDRQGGTLLFTGGGLALFPGPGVGTLSVGKAAIRNLALTFAKELSPQGIHAATVTICGMIQPGTFFAPEKIAEVYWQLHLDQPGAFRDEVIYRQGGAS